MFRIRGKVVNIFFPKAGSVNTNNFYIFALGDVSILEGEKDKLSFTKYNTLSVQGNLCDCKVDSYITVQIEFLKSDARFGTSYKITEEIMDFELNTETDLKTFISTLEITDRQKDILINTENIISIIKKGDIEELVKIKGIGEFTAKRILDKYEKNKDMKVYHEMLFKMGFESYTHRVKIINHYIGIIKGILKKNYEQEEDIPKVEIDKQMKQRFKKIKENPYILTEIEGFGLKTVDEIAVSYLKIPYDCLFRLKKFAEFILEENGNCGRSYLPFNGFYDLFKKEVEQVKKGKITTVMSVNKDLLINALLELQKEDKIYFSKDGSKIALKYFYDLELDVCNELKRVQENVSDKFVIEHTNLIVKDVEMEQGFEFSDEQKGAIDTMIDSKNGVVVLTGFAGVGKTSVTNAVHRVFEGFTVGQFCYAGKASQRMAEVTGKEASTIHMHLAKFKNTEDRDLNTYDIYIVDEASMVHLELMLSLLRTIPNGAKLFILGDEGQLQSLTTGNLLSDIINSGSLPVARLTKVYRQGMSSGILSTSVKVRNQEQLCKYKENKDIVLGEKKDLRLITREDCLDLENLVIKTYADYYVETQNVLEIQVLTPLNKRGNLSAENLNQKIQNLLSPYISETYFESNKLKFHIGDKVVCIKNNYKAKTEDDDTTSVFNGSLGLVVDFIRDSGVIIGLLIDFVGIGRVKYIKEDCSKINLAYALTVHKCQGSEFKNVIYALSMQAYSLLNKENVYTGITRAKQHCTVISESSALHTAISTSEINSKLTFLQNMLCS